MLSFESKLYDAIAHAGFCFDGQIDFNASHFQRFRLKNHHKNSKDVFVKLFPGGASFGDWHNIATWITWFETSWKELSYKARDERIKIQEEFNKKKAAIAAYAIKRACKILEHKKCTEAKHTHPYIVKKRIIPYYAYQIRSRLIIPIHNISGDLQSLQFIKPNGFKQFKKNAPTKNGFMFMGERIRRDIDTLWICEGWATGCSIYEAVGQHVICAMTASNIKNVTEQFRIKYPANPIVICADNDSHLSKNTGVLMAKEAASIENVEIKIPDICGDWNDLMCQYGIEKVESQLLHL